MTTDNVRFKLDEVEVCQFTGLCDENGREIFSGDIISINEPKDYFEVVFNNGAFYPSSKKLQTCDKPYNIEFYEYEGNIYENRELLE